MSTRKYIISALSALLLPAAAFAQESGPVVEYLYNNANKAYFHITPDPQLETLSMDIYTDVRSFSKIATIDLLSDEMGAYAVNGMEDVYELPINKTDNLKIVYQLTYKYVGSDEVTGKLHDGNAPFVYMTDIPGCNPLPDNNFRIGWGERLYNKGYHTDSKITVPLKTTKHTYAKGYCGHGAGWVETPSSIDLSQFKRFCADVGGQVIENPSRGRIGFLLYNGVDQAYLNTGNVDWTEVFEWDFTLQATGTGKTLKVSFTDGGDGNRNDFACIGAPRFYYDDASNEEQEPQIVEFDTPGRTILDGETEVTLSAFASGGTPVFYTIVSGADFATLEGNVLKPKDGYNGEVVVEAMTLGDRSHAAASATQTYNFRFGPAIEYLYTYMNSEDNSDRTMYLYVERKEKQLDKLTLDIYDDVRNFKKIKTVDFISEGLDKYAVSHIKNVYAIPLNIPGSATAVHRLTYQFAGEDEVAGPLYEGKDAFVYMTDIPGCNPLPNNNFGIGWGERFHDIGYGGALLKNSKYTYVKGYSAHASGWVETPSTIDLSQFSRFCVDVGGQMHTNTSRGRLGFQLYNGISQAYLNTGNIQWTDVVEWDFPLQATGAGKTLKVSFTDGGDGNQNDFVCIGAPRFYYNHTSELMHQTIEWIDEEIINNYRIFTMPLTATASSGLPVIYRVVKGAEYARIENNNNLRFYNIPSEGEVLVEAFQPGSKDYEPSNIRRCSFHIRRAMIIRADERMELESGHDIDELVIYGNANSTGQAVVKNGIVNVKKLVLKYTFVPGEWNYISFPSDLDMEGISNLREKGFSCAAKEGIDNTYILREYDSRLRAENPSESPWVTVTSGKVSAMKGYIMKIESADKTPIEITFNIDNVALDFDNSIRHINLSIDMSKCEPETRHTVYIRPANVKGNTLRVDMRYVPSSREDLPLNHARALQAMRVTRSEDGGSIRLTLPEQTPAKVAIFDGKGENLLKAVRYISPMKIDVSDLEHGTYRMVVIYGPASIEKEIEL